MAQINWQEIAESLGCDNIKDMLTTVYAKGGSLTASAQMIGVSWVTFRNQCIMHDVKTKPRGGANNHKKGICRYCGAPVSSIRTVCERAACQHKYSEWRRQRCNENAEKWRVKHKAYISRMKTLRHKNCDMRDVAHGRICRRCGQEIVGGNWWYCRTCQNELNGMHEYRCDGDWNYA